MRRAVNVARGIGRGIRRLFGRRRRRGGRRAGRRARKTARRARKAARRAIKAQRRSRRRARKAARRARRRNRRVVVVATQPPHRCHVQMVALQACNRRCRGRRGRKRRCRRAVAACQNVARHALRQCMSPQPVSIGVVIATAAPHRCQAQINVLNACSPRGGRCGRRCRRDRMRCRKAARSALRACMTPVTIPATVAATAAPTAAPEHPCARIRRRLSRCKTRRCRHSRGRKLRRCLGIPPRPVQYVPCARQIAKLAGCRTHACKRRARRALRRCRGIAPRTTRAPTSAPRVPHVCDRHRVRLASCRHHKCRVAARCRFQQCHCHGGVRRLRKLLRIAGRIASRCGDVDRACVDRSYSRVAALKRQISREKRQCRNRAHKSCRRLIKRARRARRVRRVIRKASRRVRRRRGSRRSRRVRRARKIVRRAKKAARRVPCRQARRRVRRLVSRRASRMAAVRRCSDEDAKCASRLLSSVLKLNRKIRKLARRCKVVLPKSKKRSARTVRKQCKRAVTLSCGPHVYAAGWRHAITCNSIRKHLKSWTRFWTCKRKVLFAQHKRCDPLDTSCMHFAFSQLIHIAHHVRRGRTEATERLRLCDECAPIKLQFRRWLRRQRARRLRLHHQILRCRNSDVRCQSRRLHQIKVIQRNIEHRRSRVMNLHGECQARGGTHSNFMSTAYSVYTDLTTTTAPAVERLLGNSAAAATVSALVVLVVALLL